MWVLSCSTSLLDSLFCVVCNVYKCILLTFEVNVIKHLLIPFSKLNRFVSKTIFLSVLWYDLAYEKKVNLFLRVLLANPMKKFLENLLNFSWRLDHFILIKIFYLTQKRSSLQIRAGRKKRYLLVAAIFSFC